jgi:hypothetical protein
VKIRRPRAAASHRGSRNDWFTTRQRTWRTLPPIASTSTTEIQTPLAFGDHCPSCGAPVAPDQRYCVECGERCAEPRLPFVDGRPQAPAAPAAPPRRSRRPRASTGLTLIAGVATLLLAMGVGVLVGKSGKDDQTAGNAPPVQVVTVPGAAAAGSSTNATGTQPAGSGATTADSSTSGSSGSSTSGSSGSSSSSESKHSGTTSTPAKKAASKAPPKPVTLGSKGHGRGYKNGKFTGDFFGG